MAGQNKGIVVMVVVLVLALVIGIPGGFFMMKSFGLIGQTVIPGGEGGNGGAGAGDGGSVFFCDQNPSVDLQARSKNLEVTTANQYDNVTVLVKNTKSGVLQSYTIDNAQGQSGDAFDTFADALVCGDPYQIAYRATLVDDVSSYSKDVAASDTLVDPYKADGNSWTVAYLRAKVYDVDQAAWMYSNSSTDNTAYIGLSGAANFSNTTRSHQTVGKVIAADDTYHVRIYVKTNTTDTVAGIKNWLAVDYLDDTNSDDWEKPVVSVDGVALSDIAGELDANDILALNSYEAIYDLGKAIKESDVVIDFSATTGGGVNADKDFTLRFAGTAIYTDDKNSNGVIGLGDNAHGRAFRMDTSRTEILFASPQTMLLMID